jgi:hypothetical protein
MGWQTVIKNENIKAVVSYEPGSGFIFPEGEDKSCQLRFHDPSRTGQT